MTRRSITTSTASISQTLDRADSPGRSRDVGRERARPRPTGTRRSSVCSTLGTSRCSSTRLRTNSLAKILAEPNLVALDGQPARFLVGGLFPFPVPQSSSIPGGTAVVTVQFQRFGTILTFLPEILPNDVIRLDVEPVISQLNFAQATTVDGGNVPSITSAVPGPSSSCARARRWRSPGCSSSRPTPPRPGFPAWAICRSSAPGSARTGSRRSRPKRSCWSLPSWSHPSTRRTSPKRPATASFSPTTPSSTCSAVSKENWAASSGPPRPARPAQSHETFPERAAVGGRAARPFGLVGMPRGA